MARSVYATIEDMRKVGLVESEFSDDDILTLLELASDIVELCTGQVFGPVYKVLLRDGLHRRIAEDEQRNKILEVIQIQLLRYGILRSEGFLSDTPQLLNGNDFQLSTTERFVRLRPRDASSSVWRRAFRDLNEIRFPNDDGNVEIRAVYGWLETPKPAKFETTLAEDLNKGDLSVKIVDEGDIEEDELLLIDNRFWVIVQEITPAAGGSPASIKIDPSPKKALIPSGGSVSVVRYGQTPRIVRQAVIRTAIARSVAPGSGEEANQLALGRIRREETDNYEIEFYQAPGADLVNTGTGDPIADAWLSKYRAPTVKARWV